METLYHQTNALIQQTQTQFGELETSKGPVRMDIEQAIQDRINQITSNCEKLDVLVQKVPVLQRPHAKMRCDQLKYDGRHLQAALASAQQKRQRQEEAASEREQLLSTRFRANSDTTAIDLDYAMQQHGAMQRANRGVDEMLYTGSSALDSLRTQRSTLKGAQKRVVDMANNLGLSTHILKLIERRAGQDKYIFLGGLIVTMLVIVLVIIYLL